MKKQEIVYVKGRTERARKESIEKVHRQFGISPETLASRNFCKDFVADLQTKYHNDFGLMSYSLLSDYMTSHNGNAPYIPVQDLLDLDIIGGNDFTVEEDTLWYAIEAKSIFEDRFSKIYSISKDSVEYPVMTKLFMSFILNLANNQCKSLED